MIIEKITFRNLTSFRGEQEIDFTAEPLRSASLYAITGDTGAGKSTILDAICLALYNHAPRMDAVETLSKEEKKLTEEGETKALQNNDPRNIMRRGEKEAASTVTFSLPDGSRYEATWQCRIKRTGNYDSVQRILRQIAPKKRDVAKGSTREVQPYINNLLGLSYEQFSRTVMLAQNSFATFLQAKKEHKSALLEKLTGTEIYGQVSVSVHKLTSEAEKRVNELKNLISGLLHDRLSEQELEELTTETTRLETLTRHLTQQATLQATQLKWLTDYDKAKENVEALEKENIEAQRALNAMRGDELDLQRYDAVLPVQPLFQEIVVHRADMDSLKQQDDALLAHLTEGRKSLVTLEGALTTAREQKDDAEMQLEQRLPVISRGYAIKGEISEATKQLEKLEQQQRHAQMMLEDRTQRLHDKRATLTDMEKHITQLQSHHDALAVYRNMFEKIDLIKDKLGSLRSEADQNKQDRKDQSQKQNRQRELNTQILSLEQRRQTMSERLMSLKGELLIHKQTNQGLDGTLLNREVNDNRRRIDALRHADNLWRRLAAGYEDIDNQCAKLKRDENNIEQLRRDIARANIEVTAREEAYQHLHQAYMLSNSENIRRLRRSLKEGTACPVCGATHHPYHTETEREREAHGEIGELMDRLEKEHAEAVALLNKKREERDALQQRLSLAEGELNAEKAALDRLVKTQRQDEEEWKNYAYLDPSFAECSQSVASEARKTLLGMLTDNATRAEQKAAEDLKTFDYHQELINKLTAEIEKLDNDMADDRRQYDTLTTDLKIISSSLDALQQRITRSDRAMEQLYRDLDENIELSEWFADWQNNPDNFRLRLNTLFQDWTGTTSALEEQLRAVVGLREEVRTAEEAEQEANRQLTAARDERSAAGERLAEKNEEMRRLFGAEQPEEEEQRLRTYVQQMQQRQADAQQTCQDAASSLHKMEGEHRNLVATRDRKQTEYGRKMSELDIWMSRFSMHHSPLQYSELEKIFNSQRDWQGLRRELDALHKQQTLVGHRLSEARDVLIRLRTVPGHPSGEGGETEEAIAQALEQTRDKQKETDATIIMLKARRQSHENSTQQAAQRTAELTAAEDDLREWQRLDTLIGSADGKKFRELAQSYTFRYLVACANHHLQRLSPRYELQALPGSLVLEVIDRDMFDERRYVTSLSGGETFVVSLALALGLAGLSAGNLHIGSLFIDEGFGNLDHESLDLVMTALSNLENTEGRKVGVISHTDQIRQQIQPQIRVRKTAGGRSVIKIS